MPTHSLGLLGATEREGRMKRKGGIEKERKRGSPSLWPLPLPWLLKLRGPLALDFCAPAPSPLPLLPLSLSRILPPVLAPDNLLKQVNSLPLRRFESFLAPALVFFVGMRLSEPSLCRGSCFRRCSAHSARGLFDSDSGMAPFYVGG